MAKAEVAVKGNTAVALSSSFEPEGLCTSFPASTNEFKS